MFISALELFKIGIGPSSSHTMGPMVAANDFIGRAGEIARQRGQDRPCRLRCTLKGSLAYTGKGHATDRAVVIGLHGHAPETVARRDVDALADQVMGRRVITVEPDHAIAFSAGDDIIFDRGEPLPQHPNGMIFELVSTRGRALFSETYFSIGGGFICTLANVDAVVAPLKMEPAEGCKYPFDSAQSMLQMAAESGLSIAAMKRINECEYRSADVLDQGLDEIWQSMRRCVDTGLANDGVLPGGLDLPRRAKGLYDQLLASDQPISVNEWLCAYALAVSEENAAGHMVVTASTNGAAGVIPAVLFNLVAHEANRAGDVGKIQGDLFGRVSRQHIRMLKRAIYPNPPTAAPATVTLSTNMPRFRALQSETYAIYSCTVLPVCEFTSFTKPYGLSDVNRILIQIL
jgi:L-serine dehydratase